ncbi:Na/Pi cotransporter family protein [Pleomorphomonas oryzae]|uniref:Na/Pi cotransporter family protein n=1 Tax=Pleomorphomonas oryzae TaxID=261934 RepID=UPI00042466CF|nr:Na/Pi symporter [Pleomorphomonas oryzae]
MTILNFAVQLLSGAMLLLFAVRFMRIGIERLWSSQIRSSLNEGSSTFRNLMTGTGLGFVMQGSTAVMLIAAGLASTGSIPVGVAATVALGADMGSAFAVQFLQLPVSALGPFCILVGATLYLRSTEPRLRNYGRTILGLGLIFLSLSVIRLSVAPLATLPGANAVVDYLNSDPITALLLGGALTLVMHSSIAALLAALAFSFHAPLGISAGLGLVLGANLGSALLPLWLLKYENARSKAVAGAVAGLRCIFVLVCLVILLVAHFSGLIDQIHFATGETMLAGHLGFNALLLLSAPFCVRLARVLDRRMAMDKELLPADLPIGVADDVGLAFPTIKRQLGNMLEIASLMLNEATGPKPDRERMAGLEKRMNATLASIREIYAKLPATCEAELADIQPIIDFAIRLERCGDVFAGKFLNLRLEQLQGEYQFSEEGKAEIAAMVQAVHQAVILAEETAWTGDVSTARRLVRHKQAVAEMESSSRAAHLARLRRGDHLSLGSSNQHLEVIAALKEVNSKFATIAYAVLEKHGDLRKSRIKPSHPDPSPVI